MRERNRRNDRRNGPATPRRAGGALWLYGLHAVTAALRNPARRVHRVLATQNAAATLAELFRDTAIVPETATPESLAALLPPGAVHQGIAAALDPLEEQDLDAFCADRPGPGLLVVLDQVSDPQNVGAVLRSAAAFGAAAVVVTRRHAPQMSGALAKAASGAVDSVPLIAVPNLARALDTLGDHGFLRVGLADDAPVLLAALDAPERLALVLGAEGPGMRRLTRERCDLLARLPTGAAMPSLNVSAAAAVALYEFARQGVARSPAR